MKINQGKEDEETCLRAVSDGKSVDNDEEEKLAFDSLWIAEPFGCSAEASWVEEIC